MPVLTILTVVVSFFFVLLLAGIIFFKVKIGKIDRDDNLFHAARRNTIVAMVVVIAFLIYWFNTFLSGKFIDEGIIGWKVYVAGFAVITGIASAILLFVGIIRKK